MYTNGNIDVAFLLEMLQPFKAPHYQLKCPPIYFGNSQNWVHREQSPNLQPRIQPNPASAPWTAKSTPVLSSFATPLDPEAPILYIPNLGDTPQSTEDTILPGEEEIVFQPHEVSLFNQTEKGDSDYLPLHRSSSTEPRFTSRLNLQN